MSSQRKGKFMAKIITREVLKKNTNSLAYYSELQKCKVLGEIQYLTPKQIHNFKISGTKVVILESH